MAGCLNHTENKRVYLVVIGWLYVVLMMAVAEAFNSTGTVLGALITFVLYGVFPVMLVVYLMRTPSRRKALKAQEAGDRAGPAGGSAPSPASAEPDAGGHAPGAAEAAGVAAVRKEP